MDIDHKCSVCVSLREQFGTCEYMHDANPSRCTCWMSAPRQRRNVQSVLKTGSTDAARLRYWREWARTEGIAQGLIVAPTTPALPILSFAGEMSAKQTSLPVAPSAEPGETEKPRRGSQK